MIGFVVVTHGNLGKQLLETVRLIFPRCGKNVASVTIDPDENTASATEKIGQTIQAVDSGSGVILLTDMFGGTPSNIGITFLENGKVEVVSGVNLPMLLRAAMLDAVGGLSEAAEEIRKSGCESITVASNLLAPQRKGPTEKKGEKE